jgi:type IV pilus assembly protein PilN
MIRINLLGLPRQKKGKRGSASAGAAMTMPSMGGDGQGPSAVVMLVAGVVIGLLVFGFFYRSANNESIRLAAAIDAANKEGVRLSGVKVKYEQRKKEAEASEKRVKVIDQLRADQAGPVNLLNTIGATVNNTDAVWLVDMNETGNSISISGMALSTQAVANLITNLKRSGYFKTVEIKEAIQDPSFKEAQAFTFSLNCEKQPKS